MSGRIPLLESTEEGARILEAGGLLAVPTETVFGLAADARNGAAVARIFVVKGRPKTHPLIVHLADASQMSEWAEPTAEAWRLAESFWPGPLTMVLPALAEVPREVTGGLSTVALRVPNAPRFCEVLTHLGTGAAAPSANRFGRLSPTCVQDVETDLGAYLDPTRDAILNGPRCEIGIESTIVDLSQGGLSVLRHGMIPRRALESCLGQTISDTPLGTGVRAPGRMSSHYAPRAQVVIAQGNRIATEVAHLVEEGQRVGVLLFGSEEVTLPDNVVRVALPDQVDRQAQKLYAALRSIDAEGVDVIVTTLPEGEGPQRAIAERLSKAAAAGREAYTKSRTGTTGRTRAKRNGEGGPAT